MTDDTAVGPRPARRLPALWQHRPLIRRRRHHACPAPRSLRRPRAPGRRPARLRIAAPAAAAGAGDHGIADHDDLRQLVHDGGHAADARPGRRDRRQPRPHGRRSHERRAPPSGRPDDLRRRPARHGRAGREHRRRLHDRAAGPHGRPHRPRVGAEPAAQPERAARDARAARRRGRACRRAARAARAATLDGRRAGRPQRPHEGGRRAGRADRLRRAAVRQPGAARSGRRQAGPRHADVQLPRLRLARRRSRADEPRDLRRLEARRHLRDRRPCRTPGHGHLGSGHAASHRGILPAQGGRVRRIQAAGRRRLPAQPQRSARPQHAGAVAAEGRVRAEVREARSGSVTPGAPVGRMPTRPRAPRSARSSATARRCA